MTRAYEIINKAFNDAGGVGEYQMPIMLDTMKGKEFPTTIKDLLGVKGRKNIRISTADLDIVVMEYRETKDELLYVALIEHYIDIVAKLSRRYQDKASAMKFKSNEHYGYDDDQK